MSTNNLTQSLLEDTTLLFASSNDNQLMVADGGSATFTYTFKVSYGKLVLGSTAGVTYSGNGSDTITLTGTSAAINAAINGLVYSPPANYFGTDTLSVLNGGATAMTFSLGVASVNDVPVTTEPSTTQSFNEDTPLVFNTANGNAITVANTNTVAALKFDGTSTSFLALPDAKLSGDITIEAWVTVDNVYRNWQHIFDFGNGKGVNNIYLAFYGESGRLVFGNYSDLQGLEYITAPSTLTDGTHHVAVGVSAQGWATLYVDGLAVTSGFVGVIANVARVNNFVGKSHPDSSDLLFAGELRDVRIWDTERSQLQIQGNMQVLGDPATPGLRAWYPMSETSGTTVANAAPAALNSAPVTRPAAVTHTTQAANLTTTLAATEGKLSLGNTVSGANVINSVHNTSTSTSTSTITLSGSAAQINAAISGMSYTPRTDYFGAAALTVTSSDGSSARTKTINFNIADVDDNITFSGNRLALTETNNLLSTSGTVVATGSGAAFTPQANVLGNNKRGSFTLASTGAWSYTTNAAHDELSAGESYTDTLSIKLGNGTPSTLTVTINGANDTPIITANSSERKFDEDTVYAFSGLNAITVSDADKVAVLKFDGTNTSFLSLPDVKLSGDITLEAWVDVSDVYRGWQRIFDFGNGSPANNIILCFHDKSGLLRFDNFDSSTSQKTLIAQKVLTSGWHHVAVSVNAVGTARMYVDGVLAVYGEVGVIPLVARANNYIGKSNWSSDPMFMGNIRDVRIWDTERTAAQIKNEMQTFSNPGATGLRAWYPMNEIDGDTVTNAATAAGAVNGTPVTRPSTVKKVSVDANLNATLTASNGTLELGSTSSGANISAGSNKSVTLTLSGTAAQINTAVDNLKYIPDANHFGAANLLVRISDGVSPATLKTINLTVNPVVDALITGNSITISETNAVLTATGKLTLNGVGVPGAEPFVAQTNVAGSQGYGSFSLSSSGNWSYTTTTAHNEFAAGILYMDRLSVVSVDGTTSTLAVNILGTNDAPEITVPGAVQTLSESGKVVFSSKVAAGNAINNAITVVDPDVVTSLKFDGTSESYLAVADTKLSGDITLEAWINVTNVNRSWQRIFDFGNGAGANNLILGFQGNSGKLSFHNFDSGASSSSCITNSVVSNGLHHVAVTVKNFVNGSGIASGYCDIYVDGVKAGWGEVGAVLGVPRINNYIGKSNWGASDLTFLGQMRDVRIWDVLRSDTEIQNGMITPVDPDAPGLRAWYAMSETTGNTVANSAMVTVDDMLSVKDAQLISAPVTRRSGVTPITASSSLTTTLTATQGTLAVGGASNTSGTIAGNTITLRGSAAEINAAMDGLVYTPPLGAGGTITVTTSDGTASDSDTISIQALQALTLSGAIASDSITGANTLAAFAGITIGNVVATHTLTARITLDSYVTLKIPGGFSYASGSSSATESVWTASGTAAQIKDMLNEVRVGATAENMVLPGEAVPFAMRLQVTNAIGNATIAGSASHIEAGDTPLIDMGSNSSISIDDTATAMPFSTFTLSDPNAIEGMTVAVTVVNPETAAGVARGEFTNYIALGFSKTSQRSPGYLFTAIIASDTYTLALPGGLKGGDVATATQAAVRALIYKPTAGAETGGTVSPLMMQVQARQGFPAANGVTPVTVAVKSTLLITSTNIAPKPELNSNSPFTLTGGITGAAALAFDGNSHHVKLADPGILKGAVTLEAWVNVTDVTRTWQRIFDLGDGAGKNYVMLGFKANQGNLVFHNSGANNLVGEVTVLNPLTSGWHHVAVSVVSVVNDAVATLYVDGAVVASGNVGLVADVARTNSYIGKSNWNTDALFQGQMRDLRVWDVARTAGEIKAQMGTWNDSAPESVNINGSSSASGLKTWIPVTATGAVTNMATGGSPTAIQTFQPALISASLSAVAEVPRALAFDGTSHHVALADPGISEDITLEAWVNVTDATRNWQRIFDLGSDAAGANNLILGFSADSGNLFFHKHDGANGVQKLEAQNPLTGGWHHVAVSVGKGGAATMYVDGASVVSGNVGTISNVARTSSYVGKSNWATDALFKGQMRDLRVWDVARTTEQIQAQMGTWNVSAPESVNINGSSSASGLKTWIPVSATGGVTNMASGGASAASQSSQPELANASPSLYSADYQTNDNTTMTVFGFANAIDIDGIQKFAADVVVDNIAMGSINTADVWAFVSNEERSDGSGATAGRWRYTATSLADLNAKIDALRLVPVNNRGIVGSTESLGITLYGNDGMSSASAQTSVLITSVNDAPTFKRAEVADMVENQPARLFAAWQVSDLDVKAITISGKVTTRTEQNVTLTIDVPDPERGYFKELNGFHSDRALNIGTASMLVLPAVTLDSVLTLEARVRVSNYTAYTKIFDLSSDGGTSDNLELYFENSKLHFRVRQGTSLTSTVVSSANELTSAEAAAERLYSVVVSGSIATLYINGTAVGSNSSMSISNSNVARSYNNVGESNVLSDGSTRLMGTVRDVRIWDSARTADQVKAGTDSTTISSSSSGLRGWWTLDTPPVDSTTDAYGIEVADSSAYNQKARVSGQPDWRSPSQYAFTGSRTAAEAALQKLQWVPQNVTSRAASAGSSTEQTAFNLTVKDELNASSTASGQVTVTAKDTAPGLVGTVTSQSILETTRDVVLFPNLEVTKTDQDGVERTVSATVSISGVGVLKRASASVGLLDADQRAYHVSGTAAAVQAALADLRYNAMDSARFQVTQGTAADVPVTLTLRNQAGAVVTSSFNLVIGTAALSTAGLVTIDEVGRYIRRIDYTLSNATGGELVNIDQVALTAQGFGSSPVVYNASNKTWTWYISDTATLNVGNDDLDDRSYYGTNYSRAFAVQAAITVRLPADQTMRSLRGDIQHIYAEQYSYFDGYYKITDYRRVVKHDTARVIQLKPASDIPFNSVGVYASTLLTGAVPFDPSPTPTAGGTRLYDSYGQVTLTIDGWAESAISGVSSDADSLEFNGTKLAKYGQFFLGNGDQYLSNAMPGFSVEVGSSGGVFTFRSKNGSDKYTSLTSTDSGTDPYSPTREQWTKFISQLVLKQARYANESRLLKWDLLQDRNWYHSYNDQDAIDDWEGSTNFRAGTATYVSVVDGYAKQGNTAPTVVDDGGALALHDTGAVMPFSGTTLTDSSNPDETNSLLVSLAPGSVPGTLVYTGGTSPFTAKNGGWYIASGTPATLQAALRLMKFVPTANVLAASVSGQASFMVEVGGTANTGIFFHDIWTGGAVTTNTLKLRSNITVTGANDAPWLTLDTISLTLNATGEQTVQPFGTAMLGDPDPGAVLTLVVTPTLTDGTTTLGSFGAPTDVTLSGTTATITGTATAVQLALKNLSYTVPAGSSGNISFGLTLTDKLITVNATTDAATSALQFDGTSHYVALADPRIVGEFTLEAWVNVTKAARSFQRIFDLGDGPNNNNLILAFDESSGNLFFENYFGPNSAGKVIAPDGLTSGWHHVAVSVMLGGEATMYVDGASVVNGNVGSVNYEPRTLSYIGKSNWATDALFQGQMRDLRVWAVARTAEQIEAQKGTWYASAPESVSSSNGISSADRLKTWIPVTATGALTNMASSGLATIQTSPPPSVRLGNVTVNLGRAGDWKNGPSISGLQAGTAVWNGGNATPLEQLVLTDGSSTATLTVTVAWATANGSATINGSTYSSGSTLTYTATGTSSASALAQAALRTLSFSPSTQVAQSSWLQTIFTLTATNGASLSQSNTAASVVQYGDRQRITLSGLPGDAVFSDEEPISPFLLTTLTDPLGTATGTTRLVTARVVLTDNAVGGEFTSYKGFTRSQTQETSTSGAQVSVVVYAARGTVSDVQSLLQQLSYRGNLEARLNSSSVAASATAAVRLELDEGGGQVATASFNLTNQLSNQIPQLVVATPVWTVDEGTATNPLSDFTVTDADATRKGQPITVYVQMVGGSESYAARKMGGLNGFAQDADATAAKYQTAGAVVFSRTFVGSTAVADAQNALAAFSFNPDKYRATPGQSSASTFSVWVSDGVYTSATVSTTVNATAVNTPIALGGDSDSVSLRTVDGRSFAPFSNLVIVDPDMGESITATLTLSDPTAGVLTNVADYFAVPTVNTDSNGTTISYTITGVAATVMAALNNVKFTPNNAPIAGSRTATLNLQVEDAANTTDKVATAITVDSADAYLMGSVVLSGNYATRRSDNGPVYEYEESNGLVSLTVNAGLATGSSGAQVLFAPAVYESSVLKIGPPVRQADGSYYWDFSGSTYSQGNRPTLAVVQQYLRAATVQGSPAVQASFKASVSSAVEEVKTYTYASEGQPWDVTSARRDLVSLGEVTGLPTTATELLLNPLIRWPLADLVVTTQAGSGESNAGVTGLSISLAKTAGGSASSNAGLVWPSDLVVGGVTLIKSPVLSGGQWRWNLDGSVGSQGARPSTAQLQAYLRGVRIQNYSADNATWAVSFTAFTESINNATRTASSATLDTAFANERALTFVPGLTLGGNSSEIAIYSADGTSGISAVDTSETFGQQVLAGLKIVDDDLTALQTVTVILSNVAAGAFSVASLGSETDESGYFTNNGYGVYTYSGSAANANVAIQRLSFVASPSVASGQTLTTLATVSVSRPNSDGTTSTATPVSVKIVAGNQSVVFLPDAALAQKSAGVPSIILMDVLQLQPFAKGALLETVSGYNAITVNVVVSDSTAGTLGNPVGTADGQGFALSADQTGLTGNQKRYTYTQPTAESSKLLAYSVLRDAVFTPNQNVAGTADKTVTLSVSAVVDGVASLVNAETGFVVRATAQHLSLAPSFSGDAAQIFVHITNGEEGDYVAYSDEAKYKVFTITQISFRGWRIDVSNTTGASNSLVTELLNSLSFVSKASSAVTRQFTASVVTTTGTQFERTAQLTVTLPIASANASLQAVMLPAWVNAPHVSPSSVLGTDVDKLKAFKAALFYGMAAVRLSTLSLNFAKQTNLLGYMGAEDYLKIVGQNLAFEKSNKLSDWTEGYAPDPKKPWRFNGIYHLEGLANHIMYTPYFEVFNNMGAHRAGSVRAKIVIGAYLTDAINAANGTENRWTDRFGRAELTSTGDQGDFWRKVTVNNVEYYDLYKSSTDGTPTPVRSTSSAGVVGDPIRVEASLMTSYELREISWRAEFVSLNYNGEADRVRLIPYNLDRSVWYDAKYEKYVRRDVMADGSLPTYADGGAAVDVNGTTVDRMDLVFVPDENGVVTARSKQGVLIERYENPLFQNAKMAEKQSRLIYATNILSFVGIGAIFSLFAMSAVQMKMQGKSDGEIALLLTEFGLAGALAGPTLKGVVQYSLLYGAATLAGTAKPNFYVPGNGLLGDDLKTTPRWLKPFQGYTTTTSVATTDLIKDALNVASREGQFSINAAMKGRALMTTRAALMLSMAANPITEAAMFVVSMFVGAVVAAQSGDTKLVLAALTAQFYTHVKTDALSEYDSTGLKVDGNSTYMLGHSPGSLNADGSAAQLFQYAAGSNASDMLYSTNASYSTMFITGMGRDTVIGSPGVLDTIVGGFSGIDDISEVNLDFIAPQYGKVNLADRHAIYDGGAGSSNVLSLQDMGPYVASFEETTYVSLGGRRINTVYNWLAVDVDLNEGTVWASGFSETDSVDTALGFDVASSSRTRTRQIYSGVEIKNIDIIMGNNLNVAFTALNTAGTTSSYFGGNGNSTAVGGAATNKFVGGLGANVFFSGTGTNDFTTGLGLNDFNLGAGTEHAYITADAGNTVIRYVNTENVLTNATKRPDATDDDELWFPVGVMPTDLAFIPVENKSLGVSYGSANGLILDRFFQSHDHRMGKFVFSMPSGETAKMDAFSLVSSAGFAG